MRRVLEVLAWLPWMMPGMVLGVGFLWAYALLPGPIQLYGTLWALLVAYVTLGTPLAVRTMSGAFAQLAYDLEECSRVHGAAWWTTFRRILLALAWPSFAVGWILIFFVILRELSASILLYSVGNEVLAVVVMRLWTEGKAGQVSVIALVMLGARVPVPVRRAPTGANPSRPVVSDRPQGEIDMLTPPSRPAPRRPRRALRRARPAAAQAPGDAEWKKVIEAAKKEGKVVVYNGAVGTPALPEGRAPPSRPSTGSASSCWRRAPASCASASAPSRRRARCSATSPTTAPPRPRCSSPRARSSRTARCPTRGRPVAPFKADGTRVPIYVIPYGILVNTEHGEARPRSRRAGRMSWTRAGRARS